MITTQLTNNQIMPIYDNIGYQYKFQGCGFCHEAFYVSSTNFIPFQLRVQKGIVITEANLICECGDSFRNVPIALQTYCDDQNNSWIVYDGQQDLSQYLTDCSECYFSFLTNVGTYSTERFVPIDPTLKKWDNMIRLDWSHSHDMAGLLYWSSPLLIRQNYRG